MIARTTPAADRRHGLTYRQEQALRGVGRRDIRFNPSGIGGQSWWADIYKVVHAATLRSLEKRGLVRRPPRQGNETEAAWELTRDGEELLARIGGEQR